MNYICSLSLKIDLAANRTFQASLCRTSISYLVHCSCMNFFSLLALQILVVMTIEIAQPLLVSATYHALDPFHLCWRRRYSLWHIRRICHWDIWHRRDAQIAGEFIDSICSIDRSSVVMWGSRYLWERRCEIRQRSADYRCYCTHGELTRTQSARH